MTPPSPIASTSTVTSPALAASSPISPAKWRTVPVSALRLDPACQPRVALDSATVAEYRDRAAAGLPFDAPVVAFRDDDGVLWVADGHHRASAYLAAGVAEIAADVRAGTRRDAILHAAGANAGHGLRRSQKDKRRAVTLLLEDPEWRSWSSGRIASHCDVSSPFVENVRREVEAAIGNDAGGEPEVRVGRDGRQVVVAPRPAKPRAPKPIAVEVVPPPPPVVVDPAEETTAEEALAAEEWLARLPLADLLAGPQLVAYRAEALAYRVTKSARDAYGRIVRKLEATPAREPAPAGPYGRRISSFLGSPHPRRWLACTAEDLGGCGGSGLASGDPCEVCGGAGYLLGDETGEVAALAREALDREAGEPSPRERAEIEARRAEARVAKRMELAKGGGLFRVPSPSRRHEPVRVSSC